MKLTKHNGEVIFIEKLEDWRDIFALNFSGINFLMADFKQWILDYHEIEKLKEQVDELEYELDKSEDDLISCENSNNALRNVLRKIYAIIEDEIG